MSEIMWLLILSFGVFFVIYIVNIIIKKNEEKREKKKIFDQIVGENTLFLLACGKTFNPNQLIPFTKVMRALYKGILEEYPQIKEIEVREKQNYELSFKIRELFQRFYYKNRVIVCSGRRLTFFKEDDNIKFMRSLVRIFSDTNNILDYAGKIIFKNNEGREAIPAALMVTFFDYMSQRGYSLHRDEAVEIIEK